MTTVKYTQQLLMPFCQAQVNGINNWHSNFLRTSNYSDTAGKQCNAAKGPLLNDSPEHRECLVSTLQFLSSEIFGHEPNTIHSTLTSGLVSQEPGTSYRVNTKLFLNGKKQNIRFGL